MRLLQYKCIMLSVSTEETKWREPQLYCSMFPPPMTMETRWQNKPAVVSVPCTWQSPQGAVVTILSSIAQTLMEGEWGCSSAVPKITVRCCEYSEEGVDTSRSQKGSVDYVIICVSYWSHPFCISLSLCLFLSINQAQATDYIMRPHPCASVEQNKGNQPAWAQQPQREQRYCVCLSQKGRHMRYCLWSIYI